MKKIIILLALLIIVSYAYTTTINIPTDYSPIQAGIDAAGDYDIVLFDTGTFGKILIIKYQSRKVIYAVNTTKSI